MSKAIKMRKLLLLGKGVITSLKKIAMGWNILYLTVFPLDVNLNCYMMMWYSSKFCNNDCETCAS